MLLKEVYPIVKGSFASRIIKSSFAITYPTCTRLAAAACRMVDLPCRVCVALISVLILALIWEGLLAGSLPYIARLRMPGLGLGSGISLLCYLHSKVLNPPTIPTFGAFFGILKIDRL